MADGPFCFSLPRAPISVQPRHSADDSFATAEPVLLGRTEDSKKLMVFPPNQAIALSLTDRFSHLPDIFHITFFQRTFNQRRWGLNLGPWALTLSYSFSPKGYIGACFGI